MALSGAPIPGQSGHGSNGKEGGGSAFPKTPELLEPHPTDC